MKIGMCFPYAKGDLTRQGILDWLRRFDEGPFSTLSCGERIVGTSVDMMAVMAAAAAVTERVRIVPTLYVLPMHSAIHVAKHAATLDVISGGRTTITVGIGGRVHDYQCMEKEPVRRYSRMDEQVAEIRRIWAGEPPFDGAEPVGPLPVQAGGPPILAGVTGPKGIARAAKWADGVYSWSGNGERDEIARQLALVDAAWGDAGRDQAPQRVAGFWFSLADNADDKLKDYVYKYIRGINDDWARGMAAMCNRSSNDAVNAALDAYEELGVDECWLNPATSEIAEIDRLAELIARR
ncbi:MAG TPA: LLM class flavin-dependent oxidoreductase [Ilumatobacteraceae bacterium]|nr:LLM class flavin-dependent oxidoreductase [Ilumatobacteraceae bacterium]